MSVTSKQQLQDGVLGPLRSPMSGRLFSCRRYCPWRLLRLPVLVRGPFDWAKPSFGKAFCARLPLDHRPLPLCSESTAPTRRAMAAPLGNIPITSVRRCRSLLSRTLGLLFLMLDLCSGGKVENASGARSCRRARRRRQSGQPAGIPPGRADPRRCRGQAARGGAHQGGDHARPVRPRRLRARGRNDSTWASTSDLLSHGPHLGLGYEVDGRREWWHSARRGQIRHRLVHHVATGLYTTSYGRKRSPGCRE